MSRLIFALLFLIADTALGATIYIDGSMDGDCTSSNYSIASRACNGSDGNAYNDVQAALSASSTGDTIRLRSGTITENSTDTHGIRPKENQTWEAYPGEAVTINAAANHEAVFYINGVDGITVRNLSLRGGERNGVYALRCDDVTLENLDVAGWNTVRADWNHGIRLGTYDTVGFHNNTVRNNFVHDPEWSSKHTGGIVVGGKPAASMSGNLIEHNTVKDVGSGIWFDVDAHGHTVQYNYVTAVSKHCYHIEARSAWTLQGNICENPRGSGIHIRPGGGSSSMSNHIIRHNLVYNAQIPLWIAHEPIGDSNYSNAVISDNIFVSDSGYALIQVATPYHNAGTNVFANNLLFSNHANDLGVCWGDDAGTTTPDCDRNARKYADTASGYSQWHTEVSGASGTRSGDPLFRDPSNRDFNFEALSPGINAGSDGRDIGPFHPPRLASAMVVEGKTIVISWLVENPPVQNCDYTKYTVTADGQEGAVVSCTDQSDAQTKLTLASAVVAKQRVEVTGADGCVEDSQGVGRTGSEGLNGKARPFTTTISVNSNPSPPQRFRVIHKTM
jgi:hypothetical protein